MRRTALLMAVVGGVLSLSAATYASAAGITAEDIGITFGASPSQQGGPDGDRGRPENPGPPSDPGKPEGVGVQGQGPPESPGRPADLPGNAGLHTPPELPEQASPRAHAAVAAAFELQTAIQLRIAAIHAIEPGPGKGDAVSALMKDEFADLVRLVPDAVAAAEANPNNSNGDGDG